VSEDLKKIKAISPDQEIKIISEISSLVQAAKPEKEVFEEILKLLGKIVDFRSASLYLLMKDDGRLEEVCTVGRKVELIGFVNFEMGNGISAWVAKHRRPIVLNNLRKSKDGTHTKSFISVPMLFMKEILGVLNIAHDEPESYTKRDSEVVSIVSSIMALLVERMSHQEALETKSRAIEILSKELDNTRKQLRNDEHSDSGQPANPNFAQKISNPLAIISGNAQFLLMSLKSGNSSTLKRLKAIESEAANIQEIVRNAFNVQIGLNPSQSKNEQAQEPILIEL
jgi:transcriptional regulator with GAF, ATPase, and Fis domain